MFFFDCLRRNGVSCPAENRLQFLMNAAAKRTLRGVSNAIRISVTVRAGHLERGVSYRRAGRDRQGAHANLGGRALHGVSNVCRDSSDDHGASGRHDR